MIVVGKGLYFPRELAEDSQIGPAQKLVYAVMLKGADEDGICRMTAQQIGEACGMTKVTAQNNRWKLCHYGYAELCPDTKANYRLLKYL